MAPWGGAKKSQWEGLKRQERGDALGVPPSCSLQPVPIEQALDQKTNERAGWCACVIIISESGPHSLGEETTLTYTGTHLLIHSYVPMFIQVNVNLSFRPPSRMRGGDRSKVEKCEGILRSILDVHKAGGGGLNICWLWHCMGHTKELIPGHRGKL